MTRAFLRNAAAVLFAMTFAACDVPPDAAGDPDDDAPVAVIDPLLAADAAAMTLQNRESVPFPDRLVFSSLSGDTTGQKVHDHSVLRLSSTGTAPLVISALTFSGPFAASPRPTLPLTVAPGSHVDLTVAFTATALGKVQTGSLTIATNVPGAASVPVALAGSRTKPEGGNEPSFVQLVQIFGYKTTIVGSGQQLNQHGLVQAVGDEVLAPFWKPLDASKPVAVRQLAAYHTRGGTGPIAWYAQGSTTVHTIVASGGDNAQTVLPRKSGSTTSASSGSFTPGGTFGLKVAGEFSEPQRNNVAKDMQNGCPGPCGHHVRFWPAKDRAGTAIPGTFIIAMDSSSVNYDYQDDVFLISNATPQ